MSSQRTKKRTKTICRSCVDRISSLPDSLQNCILSKLPIQDAARTSLLSSKWRYKWLSLPNLILDNMFLRLLNKNPKDLNRVTDTISKILLRHDGPITVFSLSSKEVEINSVDIDTWIMYLRGKSIKDLTLKLWSGKKYRLHSRLFSFPSLRSLELGHCAVQLPSLFTGFKCLTKMCLSKVTIETDDFDNLTAKCLVLTDLVLSQVDGLDCVTVSAPRIKKFKFLGEFRRICFKICMPGWMSISYILKFDTLVPPEEGLIKGPSLATQMHLEADQYFMKALVAYDRSYRHLMLDFPLKNLESVHLCGVPFHSRRVVSCLLWLIMTLPKLSYLWIAAWTENPADAEQDHEHATKLVEDENRKLGLLELRQITITQIIGASPEMEFMRMLLAKSPLLETMTVKVDKDEQMYDDKKILKDLLSFPRASTTAKVIFFDQTDPIVFHL